MVGHACDLSTRGIEAGGSGHLWLYSKFEANLGYTPTLVMLDALHLLLGKLA